MTCNWAEVCLRMCPLHLRKWRKKKQSSEYPDGLINNNNNFTYSVNKLNLDHF